jgi:hypothetical protein
MSAEKGLRKVMMLIALLSPILLACGGGGGGSSSPANQTAPPPVTDPATEAPFPIFFEQLERDGYAVRHLWPAGERYPAAPAKRAEGNKIIVRITNHYGDIYEVSVSSRVRLAVGGESHYYLTAGTLAVDTAPWVSTRDRAPATESVSEAENLDLADYSSYGMIELRFERNGAQTTNPDGYLCYNFRLTIRPADLPTASLVLFSQGH